MIGCIGYSDTLECVQYVNDVTQMKVLYLIILLILASLTLFFIGSKSYKMLSRKYETIETMFILPRYSSYLFFFSLIFIPFFLSVNTSLETYMNYIYAFLWTNITWVTLMIFLLLANYLFVKLGFKSTSHFYKSLRSKK